MDFYGKEIMWVKKQKKIEEKLFDELVKNAIKEYGTWEYKLNYVENLLKYNHINEWEYTEKLNALKRQFDYFNTDDYSDDDDEEEEVMVVKIDETDTHLLFRAVGTDIYYVVSKETGDQWAGPPDTDWPVARMRLWFRRGVYE